MSLRFQDILQRELQAQGAAPTCLPAAARTLSVAASAGRTPGTPCVRTSDTPAVNLAFSPEARQLSSSLQNYAVDLHRTAWRDSGILAGNSESGCLWKSEQGLSGEMRFMAGNGQQVRIAAGSAQGEPSWDVRVEVTCAGEAYDFALEELVTAKTALDVPFCLALEAGSPSRPESGGPQTRADSFPTPVYSARGALRNKENAAPRFAVPFA